MPVAEKRSGSYSVRVSLTDSISGKRTQKRVTARTKRELDAKVSDLKARWNNGTYVEPVETPLREYMISWLETASGKDATWISRDSIIRNHIQSDPIGFIPLGRLKRSHIQDFIDRKARVCAPSYVALIYATVRRALRRAVVVGILPVSPCDSIELPKADPKPMTSFSEEETRLFLKASLTDDLAALWMLASTLGLRRGELIGLRWDDLNMQRGTLTVARTQTRGRDGKWKIGDSTKRPSSHRTIQLPAICLSALRSHRTRQLERRLALGDAWQDTDTGAIFDAGDGSHFSCGMRLNHQFDRICKSTGLPRIKLHCLRHTAATNMLMRGVPVHVVANVLGHADASITLRVYAHVLSDMQQAAADHIDAMFGT